MKYSFHSDYCDFFQKAKQLNGSSLEGRAIGVKEALKPLKNKKSKSKQSPRKNVGKTLGKGSPKKSNDGKFKGKGNQNQNKQNFNKGPKQGLKRGPQTDFNKTAKAKKVKTDS